VSNDFDFVVFIAFYKKNRLSFFEIPSFVILIDGNDAIAKLSPFLGDSFLSLEIF
jgi:hypothetical protein